MHTVARLDAVCCHLCVAARSSLAGVLIAAGGAATAQAQTAAGSAISNQATVRAIAGTDAVAASSNVAVFLVAERLDVALTGAGQPAAPTTDGVVAVPADLANAGNGNEAFALVATAPAGIAVRGIAIDVDGDGRYDPAIDRLIDGGATPVLPAGAHLKLLVLVDGAAAPDASVTLVARAATGSGAPGTDFPGRGDGGTDAVVGPTGAEARLVLPLGADQPPVLAKSQSVLAPDGSATPVRDAVVTYTLRASFAAAAQGVRIDDPLPAGTVYVPGSLTLDGAALTDAADGDAGGCDGTAVTVALGDVPARAARTIRFQARLQ